jgi:MerR family transcriptional regulator, light-induced transcriptional regulator
MAATGGLNIAALSRRTGVAPDTLRKWELRYGVLNPARTAGGQRRYGEDDVSRIEWLLARLAEGFRIGEAASLLTPHGDAPRTSRVMQESLLRSVDRVDARGVGLLLDQAFALGPVESTFADVIEPVLRRVGDGWESGRFTAAQEHLLSTAVRGRLERLLADARGDVRGVAVLACAPEERHELGLLMLAVLLRADGWQVAYLGADVPLADALAFARAVPARMLCLSASLEQHTTELLPALRDADRPRGLEVVLGGAGITAAQARSAGARYAGADARAAVTRLRAFAA